MKPNSNKPGFLVIQDWMYDLDLSVSETLCYAAIYGYSQDGVSCFDGSREYLARKMKAKSPRTADAALKSLVDMGLINKRETFVNGVKFCSYSVDLDKVPTVSFAAPASDCAAAAQPAAAAAPVRSASFDFRSALLNLGVEPSLADDWLKVRKVKKMVNTEVAFAAVQREIAKSGRPAAECIRLAVEKSWGGFKAEWMFNDYGQPKAGPSHPVTSAPRRGGVEGSEEIAADAYAAYQNL